MDLALEGRRQLAGVRLAYDETRQARAEYLRIACAEQAHDRTLNILRSASVELLLFGQADYVLDGDAALARKTFADLAAWESYLDALQEAAAAESLGLSASLLLEPVVCALLAGDAALVRRLAAIDDQRMFMDPGRQLKVEREFGGFVLDLLSMLRTSEQFVPRSGKEPVPPQFMLAGYDALVRPLAKGDAKGFESVRAKLEAAFPARTKHREAAINWYGYGKVAQAMTFDALGTAMCGLAVRRGLSIKVDSSLYPGVFIRV